MENKCWDCVWLARCKRLVPCSKFVRFRSYVTTKEVAKLCGVSERTMYRQLKKDWIETVYNKIVSLTGFEFQREYRNSRSDMFVLETNSPENIIKLAKALQELEDKNGSN